MADEQQHPQHQVAAPIQTQAPVAPPAAAQDNAPAGLQVKESAMTGLAVAHEPIMDAAIAVEAVQSDTHTAAPAPTSIAGQQEATVQHAVSVDQPTSAVRASPAPESKQATRAADAELDPLFDEVPAPLHAPISPPQEPTAAITSPSTTPAADVSDVQAQQRPAPITTSVPPIESGGPTPPQSSKAASPKREEPGVALMETIEAAIETAAEPMVMEESAPAAAPATTATTEDVKMDDVSESKPDTAPAHTIDPQRKMTPNRQKYCLVVIRQLKKNKDAGPFNGPVDPVKLKIPDYPNIIKNPQDLGTIEKRLQKNEYETIDAFMEAVFLVFSNCERYNGLESPINKMALRVKEQFERQIRSMPPPDFSAPANNKKSKKATPHVATNGKAKAASPAVPATTIQPPTIRRESTTGQDGRPKREIHAPPPKSLPYQNVPVRRGKHAQQLKFCGQVLRELQRKQHEPYAFPFYVPVDPVALNIPEYTKVIKHPMDLGTIDSKLKQGEYESAEDFEFDVRLIFRNCYKFNPPGTPVQAMGKKLEAVFNQKWAEKPVPRAQQGESDSDDSDDGKMQTVQMLTKQLEAMKNQIAGLKQGKTKKKERSQSIVYHDDDDDDYEQHSNKRKSYAAQQASKKRGRQSAYDDVDESPMIPTFEQKTALSTKMGYMTEHQMPVVIQILKRTESNFDPEDEEVELDVDKVHPQTIRLLWNWIMEDIQPSFLRKRQKSTTVAAARDPTSSHHPAPSKKHKKSRAVLSESEQQRQIEQLEQQLQRFNGEGGALPEESRYAEASDSGSDLEDSSEDED